MTNPQRTPFQVDTELAELYREYGKAQAHRNREIELLRDQVGDKRIGRPARWGMTPREVIDAARQLVTDGRDNDVRYGIGSIARRLAEIEQLGVTKVEIGVKIAECDREYDAAGRWSRFFLATSHNGHVHSSMDCSTCNRNGQSTEFAWLPELSGKTEAEAVEEWGEKMCTVCFPSAPANPAFGQPSRRDREAAEAKAAAKAAKDADKAAKAITNPDGTALVVGKSYYQDKPKTLIAAQRLLLARLKDVKWYQVTSGGHREEKQWLADADVLVAAIAHKTGGNPDQIRREALAKADKAVDRELMR